MVSSTPIKERVDQKRSFQTKTKILDAAEALFSLHGFSGTSLRDIHALSGVRASLCYYHFGSKDDVLQAVVDRRAAEHQQCILESLDQCRKEAGNAPLSVEKLVDAYIRPIVERHWNHGDGWRNYTRLMAYLASESAHLEPKVQFNKYDAVRQVFVKELQRSVPHASLSQIHWGFFFLRATLINLLLDTEIVDHQSEGLCDSSDVDNVIKQLQWFFSAGFRQQIEKTSSGKRPTSAVRRSASG
jgi:AcrR family transcriptional regulator